jgi:putative thioredoxin
VDPEHAGARLALARLLLADGRTEELAPLLEPIEHQQEAQSILAMARLHQSDQPDVAAGLAALQRGDREAALSHLLDAVRATTGETRDDLRLAMLGLFAELGDQHPLVQRFRRRLAQALY